MNDDQYREYCLQLLESFNELIVKESDQSSEGDPMRELVEAFTSMSGESLYRDGPILVARLFASCPHIAPAFPRELLWFLGGDCLHYMPDEELQQFQQLDEMRIEAASRDEIFDYPQARAKLLKLQ
jgi:hypothetical protein